MTDKTDSKEREALVTYLKDCDAHGIVPDVGGAWRAAFQAGRASLAASAGSEPVAWRVRRHDAPNYWIIFLHRPVDAMADPEREVQPLYTHPSPPEGMVGGWISVEDVRKPPPGKPVVFWVWAERYQEDDDGRQIAQDASGLHLGEWREAEHGNYFDNYSTPFADREAVLWWMDPAPPTTSAGSRKGE